ncbi:collagen alpha-1(XIV) chain-like [Paramacrobiotus metropolitanus]|uniref:collagen alpha-1(XIV) chain-like n=1 Tax=Paramacrobiotus metropolitanus TaxID=2943436 RepID=UPI002446087D|nr:collagen alpha-1(XIV) chain-like [Paramacrobiotus metropolitanus]
MQLHDNIKNLWNVQWKSLDRRELLKPFYSGLAARLTETAEHKPIPVLISAQADYWQTYYNPLGSRPAFQTAATSDACESQCPGRLDICIMMDSSGSIGFLNFFLARVFLKDLLGSFEGGSARAALVVFSSTVHLTFPLDTNMTWSEKRLAALDTKLTPHLRDNTHTAAAIKYCIDMFNSMPSIPGVPKINLVITDGQSNDPGPETVADTAPLAAAAGISSFAVGVGAEVVLSELLQITGNHRDRLHYLDSFQDLAEFFRQLNQETCEIPQTPRINDKISDSLIRAERRYFRYSVSEEGLHIRISTTAGKTAAYYSYAEKTPSDAVNDGKIDEITVIPYHRASTTSASRFDSAGSSSDLVEVYITVVGMSENNNYTIQGTTHMTNAVSVPNHLYKIVLFIYGCLLYVGSVLNAVV